MKLMPGIKSIKNLFQMKYTKSIIASVLLLLTLLNFYIAFFAKQQVYQASAWDTDQSADAICQDSGNVGIRVSFTNKEPAGGSGMIVTVLDNQTGKTIDLGAIAPQETKSGVIDTGTNSISANTVQFKLKWADGRSGTDSRTMSYTAKQCVPQVTPTTPITPSITVTPTSETTPTVSPTVTKTITPSVTSGVTPTVTKPVTPTVSVTSTVTPTTSVTPRTSVTPSVTSSPSSTPTTIPTGTPQPTSTPYPTYTGYPSSTPTPTEIIIIVNNTNTPTPAGSTTPVPSIPVAGSPISWFMILIPIALLTFGLVF